MTKRERIKAKFGGLCAYSGTPLEDDWQMDHLEPIRRNWFSNDMLFPKSDIEANLYPCQKMINHYKGSLSLPEFRDWYLAGLHNRLKKIPKNPKTEKSARKKEYLLKIASYFGITPDKPFIGIFYFETLNNHK